jgi:membrane fusion protein (multidrug efflux system)
MNVMDKFDRSDARTVPARGIKGWWRRRALRTRRLITFVPILLVVMVVILGYPLARMLMRGFPAQPAPAVSTITVHASAWQPRVDVVGSLTASRGADLAVEVAGVVEQVFFNSGGQVRAGQPLLRLRSQDDVARLRTLQAASELAQAQHARNLKLLTIQGIAQADIEASAARLKSAQAAVAEQQAVVAKKVVNAPFAGRLGIRNVNAGQYVQPGTVVATLQVLDPINFDFNVPQQVLQQLHVGQTLAVKIDAYPDTEFAGRITTIDPKVDPGTRNVAIRAELANAAGQLLPGMYATAVIETGAPQNFLTVPQTAVTFNPYGNTVFRVEEKTEAGKKSLIAHQAFVTTGERRGDQITILNGVKDGDLIVSAGQFKLQNGAAITVNNDVQPTNDPNARPQDR